MNEYQEAIRDYTKALEGFLGTYGFNLTMHQFRALYPEYHQVSDEDLRHKIRLQFWPQFTDGDVLRDEPETEELPPISNFQLTYEQRGDAYLATGDFRRALADFHRIRDGLPPWQQKVLERWQPLETSKNGTVRFLDIQTVELMAAKLVRLWIKLVGKDASYTAFEAESDCQSKRMQTLSQASYDAEGNMRKRQDNPLG